LIADHANNPRGALGDGVEFLRGLDDTERQRECGIVADSMRMLTID